MQHKNFLLDKYSHSISNDEFALKQYCAEMGYDNFIQIREDLNRIQEAVMDSILMEIEEGTTITPDELAGMVSDYCRSRYEWISNVGIHALNRWLNYQLTQKGLVI